MKTEPLRGRYTYSYEERARKKKQSLRREIRIHRKSARAGKPYAEERREKLTALVAWFL
jgi:U3 small nucleolar ribonucleoprotein component